jgi:hypothetical protein
MLAATLLGIFFIPALFVLVERFTTRKAKHNEQGGSLVEPDGGSSDAMAIGSSSASAGTTAPT